MKRLFNKDASNLNTSLGLRNAGKHAYLYLEVEETVVRECGQEHLNAESEVLAEGRTRSPSIKLAESMHSQQMWLTDSPSATSASEYVSVALIILKWPSTAIAIVCLHKPEQQ